MTESRLLSRMHISRYKLACKSLDTQCCAGHMLTDVASQMALQAILPAGPSNLALATSCKGMA